VCACILADDLDVVGSALKLGVTLLDGGNPEVQSLFTSILLPTSSGPLFKQMFYLFEDAQADIKENKRMHKQIIAENAALIKAGIHTAKKEDANLQLAQNKGHMKDTMLLMQHMCHGDSVLDDVLRQQKLNQESYNFFVQTELYVEAIEPELRDAFFRHDFELVDAAICGLDLLSQSMHGPNLENQRVIADTAIFDLCNRVFARIKFEHRMVGKNRTNERGGEDEQRIERNIRRSKLRVAALSCLDVFLEAVQEVSIIMQMLSLLNWDGVVAQLKECCDLYHRGDATMGYDLPQELSLQEGLGFFFLLTHIKHYDKKKEFIAPQLEHVSPKILAFFESHAGHIEIVRESRLERVYFQLPKSCLKGGPLDRPKVDQKIYDADREDVQKNPKSIFLFGPGRAVS